MHNTTEAVSREIQVKLFKRMLLPRLIEEKMLVLLRQGKISKWFSGIGQEAIAVAVGSVLEPQEYILPLHRNLGIFTTRGVPLHRLFAQWQGKASGFTNGRDRSFHFGTQEHKIVGMISHLGPQFGVATGVGLGNLLKQNKQVCAVFTGDGGTSEGDIHEALNIASVWQLPVLFCIENNGYGLSTPVKEQYNCKDLMDRGKGYGMESHSLDGNNVLEIYTQLNEIVADMRKNPHPVLIEFKTFRMRGHEEASGTKYVPEDLLKKWAAKDPVNIYKEFLIKENLITEAEVQTLTDNFNGEINENLAIAFNESTLSPNLIKELSDVYQPFDPKENNIPTKTLEMRFVDAISNSLKLGMQKFDHLVLLGQDIAEYGGVFKVTEGFVDEFGKERVRNTPICESAVVSAAYGLSVNGFKTVVEMQFADFASSGFNPIVNLLAKSYYRWGQAADVVIRMPCGGGVGAGPFHSQTNEAWFTKTPGLKVVYPAFPADAKGLLATSIEDPNPVLFFEHKALYRSVRGQVPEDYFTVPLGKAAVLKEGEQVTIISFGAAVHWCLEILDKHPDTQADLIDLRTLQPLDTETIYNSVKKTGKVLIVQEDSLFGGISSDISALISEHCFEYLDAPIKRVASLETPIPFAVPLENQYLGKNRLEAVLLDLLAY